MDGIAQKVATRVAREPLEKQWYIDRIIRERPGHVSLFDAEKHIDRTIRYRIKDFIKRTDCKCGVKANVEGVCLGCGERVEDKMKLYEVRVA